MTLEVDVRKLELFNTVSKEGSRKVADSLSQLSGMDANIQVAKINLLHIDDVRTHIGNEKAVGIYVELTDPPYGYVVFLLDPDDSKRLVQSMLPGETGADDDSSFTDMERSAMQEVGNIMTSGYIDGWANVLDTTIDMGTPTFSYGPSDRIIEEMGGWPDDDLALVLDSTIRAAGTDVDLTVYTFPQLHDLVSLVRQIDLDTDVETDAVADESLTSN